MVDERCHRTSVSHRSRCGACPVTQRVPRRNSLATRSAHGGQHHALAGEQLSSTRNRAEHHLSATSFVLARVLGGNPHRVSSFDPRTLHDIGRRIGGVTAVLEMSEHEERSATDAKVVTNVLGRVPLTTAVERIGERPVADDMHGAEARRRRLWRRLDATDETNAEMPPTAAVTMPPPITGVPAAAAAAHAADEAELLVARADALVAAAAQPMQGVTDMTAVEPQATPVQQAPAPVEQLPAPEAPSVAPEAQPAMLQPTVAATPSAPVRPSSRTAEMLGIDIQRIMTAVEEEAEQARIRIDYELRNAQDEADRLVAEATLEAERIREHGQAQARQLLGEVEEIISEAQQTGEQILRRADTEALTIREQAHVALQQAQDEARTTVELARREGEEILAEQRRLATIRAQEAMREQDRLKDQIRRLEDRRRQVLESLEPLIDQLSQMIPVERNVIQMPQR